MSSVCVNKISNLAFIKIDVGLGFRVSCRKDLWPLQVVVPSEIRYCPFRVCDRPLQEHITAIVDSLNRQKKGGMGEFITACATDSSRQKAPSSIRTWEQKITKGRCHKLCKGCACTVSYLSFSTLPQIAGLQKASGSQQNMYQWHLVRSPR